MLLSHAYDPGSDYVDQRTRIEEEIGPFSGEEEYPTPLAPRLRVSVSSPLGPHLRVSASFRTPSRTILFGLFLLFLCFIYSSDYSYCFMFYFVSLVRYRGGVLDPMVTRRSRYRTSLTRDPHYTSRSMFVHSFPSAHSIQVTEG